MPAQRRPAHSTSGRLARLPRRPELRIEGGIRPLSVYVREGDTVVRPAVALWLESQMGLVRSHRVLIPQASPDNGLTDAVDALAAALASPSASAGGPLGQPGLPASVRVDDAALADRVRALLDPLDVPTELVSSLPLVDEAAASLDAHLGGQPDAPPPQPFTWDIDPALLPALYEAAAAYARRAPWEYMADNPPIGVGLASDGPQRNVRTLYACILGAAGMVQGIAFYYSLAGLDRAVDTGDVLFAADELLDAEVDSAMSGLIGELRRSGAPVDQIPPDVLRAAVTELASDMEAEEEPLRENALAMTFDTAEESDPMYLEWLQERDLSLASRNAVPSFVRTRRNGEPRLPTDREVRALTLALQAVNGFLSRFRRRLATPFVSLDPLVTEVKVPTGQSLEVRWPGDE